MTESEPIKKNHWYRITEDDGITSAMIVPGGVIVNHCEYVDSGNHGEKNVGVGLVFIPNCTIVRTDRATLYGLDTPSDPPPIDFP